MPKMEFESQIGSELQDNEIRVIQKSLQANKYFTEEQIEEGANQLLSRLKLPSSLLVLRVNNDVVELTSTSAIVMIKGRKTVAYKCPKQGAINFLRATVGEPNKVSLLVRQLEEMMICGRLKSSYSLKKCLMILRKSDEDL